MQIIVEKNLIVQKIKFNSVRKKKYHVISLDEMRKEKKKRKEIKK
jgi:hypothetical protein